jgi:hypothetical protein
MTRPMARVALAAGPAAERPPGRIARAAPRQSWRAMRYRVDGRFEGREGRAATRSEISGFTPACELGPPARLAPDAAEEGERAPLANRAKTGRLATSVFPSRAAFARRLTLRGSFVAYTNKISPVLRRAETPEQCPKRTASDVRPEPGRREIDSRWQAARRGAKGRCRSFGAYAIAPELERFIFRASYGLLASFGIAVAPPQQSGVRKGRIQGAQRGFCQRACQGIRW